MSDTPNSISANRRSFLKRTSAALGALSVAEPLGLFLDRTAQAGEVARTVGYGKPVPTVDETTGLKLLKLPEGFRYRSFGWTGDKLSNGEATPNDHDGMGVVSEVDGIATLIRNHELSGNGSPFGSSDLQYDPKAPGGCTKLTFNTNTGEWLEATPVISGTVKNCAGGPTPWGTWLTCEETTDGPGDVDDGERLDYSRSHGWIFEVDPKNPGTPKPLTAMGRFKHEAVAIDPQTGIVYETEDQKTSGLYRFLPETQEKLADGGRLQMLKVKGRVDLRTGVKVGSSFDCSWVDIEDVEQVHPEGSTNGLGLYSQGKAQGACTFARLEGCWYGHRRIYINATSGGDAGCGQVWEYRPDEERLTLLFESPGHKVLESPDNLTVSPRGGIVLCEDPDHIARMHGLTPDGKLFPFAVNNMRLSGERNGLRGDFREGEWAGATFSADGKWLFANVQKPGLTFAITGPWGSGLL